MVRFSKHTFKATCFVLIPSVYLDLFGKLSRRNNNESVWSLVASEREPSLLFQAKHEDRQDENKSLATSGVRDTNEIPAS